MQLEGEKKVAKKKKTKNTATNIISENIETTNILKGANILLKDKEKKKSKKKGANEKRQLAVLYRNGKEVLVTGSAVSLPGTVAQRVPAFEESNSKVAIYQIWQSSVSLLFATLLATAQEYTVLII